MKGVFVPLVEIRSESSKYKVEIDYRNSFETSGSMVFYLEYEDILDGLAISDGCFVEPSILKVEPGHF